MKRIFIIIALLLNFVALATMDYDDFDFNFIDTAFDGIKPVTNKEFNDTVNRLTPQPVDNSWKGKIKTFFLGRQYGVQTKPEEQTQEVDLGGEAKAIHDMKNGVYYIKLLYSVVDNDGNIIPVGNYKIQEKNINNQNMLVFYQGTKEYGKLKLQNYEDTKKGKYDLTYTRVDVINDYMVRFVYSTISGTKCADARINLQK